jgi:hypothetical protein
MGYVTSSQANARRIAAIVPVANCFPAVPGSGFNQQVANLANSNIHLWGIQCAGDRLCPESNIQAFVNGVNAQNPGHAIFSYATAYCNSADSTYHYAWNVAYSPDEYRPPVSGNKNIYEWLINFSQNISLPVELKDWSARLDGNKVLFEWTTSDEFNTKRFLVQKATSTGEFQTILTVAAAISSSKEIKYSVSDEHPLAGENLYRLVLEDQDGKQQMFPIKRVIVPGAWKENVIIPNPVTNGSLVVYLRVGTSQDVNLTLLDMTGRILGTQNKHLLGGESQYSFDVSSLQRGTYIVQITGEDFKTSKKVSVK